MLLLQGVWKEETHPPVADLDGGAGEEEGNIRNLVVCADRRRQDGWDYKGLHGWRSVADRLLRSVKGANQRPEKVSWLNWAFLATLNQYNRTKHYKS